MKFLRIRPRDGALEQNEQKPENVDSKASDSESHKIWIYFESELNFQFSAIEFFESGICSDILNPIFVLKYEK